VSYSGHREAMHQATRSVGAEETVSKKTLSIYPAGGEVLDRDQTPANRHLFCRRVGDVRGAGRPETAVALSVQSRSLAS
jgi:hypothetical protein